MKTVIQLSYTCIFSLGVSCIFLILYGYLRNRSEGTRSFLFALTVFTLYTASILVSFYLNSTDNTAATQRVIYQTNRYLPLISVCFISCTLFLRFRHRFRIRLTRLKRTLCGVLIFLVPQLLFSSPLIGGITIVRPNRQLFVFITLTVAAFTAILLAIRSGKSETRIQATVTRFLLIGTVVFISGLLADLYLKKSDLYSTLSFSMCGYAALSVCTIAATLHHVIRTSNLEGKALLRFFEIHGVSMREQEIVDLLVRGFSNHRIAEMLFISVSTVKSHTASIYRKLGINSRMELASSCRIGVDCGIGIGADSAEKIPKKHSFL
ncbi:MAG: response regulator transcription factor [Spirochaetota bacterium]|nr:MAG: response regulator transcription factor [Spirochaetota bacterium]